MSQVGQVGLAGGFHGFPPEAFGFFRDLAKHNDRDWFQAHRDVYEQACREPMKALLATLDPPLVAGRISRINRDMRFARGGGPYKTYISAGVLGHYVSLSAQGLYVGGGMYKPEPPDLQRLRAAIGDDGSGKKLQAIVNGLRKKGYQVGTHGSVASAPRGYAADHPRIELLRMKDIHAGRMFEPAPWLSTSKAVARIRQAMDDIAPFNAWIKRYVKRGQV